MDVERELDELVALLDRVAGSVESHGDGILSGQSPDAQENRAIREAAARLARIHAQRMGEQLAEIRVRAVAMADQARATRDARSRVPSETAAVWRSLRAATRTLLDSDGDGDQAVVMERIVRGALHAVPGARWGGICIEGSGGAVTAHAASDAVVSELEEIQSTEGAGPCVDALNGDTSVHVPDLLAERRWSGFTASAARLGVRGVLALGISGTRHRGVLNLYAPEPGAFDDTALTIAGLFADHAALALGGAYRAGSLARAVATRDLIGQAKGILMRRHGVDADRAFHLLVEASQNSNMKLVDVARWVTESMVTDVTRS